MTPPLVADRIVEDACAATGLEIGGSGSFREGLDILVADINRDAERTPPAMETCRGLITKAVMDRLKVDHAIAARPAVLGAPVARPVFVFGIPRTGTTLLSNLLAADPARRSPLKWELADPVPPPTTATLYTDPRALKALEEERKLFAAHPEMGRLYRMSAIYPYEDVDIFAHDFKTLMLESMGTLRAYRDWVFSTDLSPTYAYHKRFLQLHQADAPGVWNLKMPSHAIALETLLGTYPDARLVWSHRDPYAATGSFCSMIESSHGFFAGHVDYPWIAENIPWQAAEHVNRVMDVRARIGHDRILDVHYADVIRDPIGTMRTLYEGLGDDFTPEAEAGMRAWLADNPQGKFGKHDYKLEHFGLSKDALAPRFERYLADYAVEAEG